MRSGIKRIFIMLSALILSASYLMNPVFGATDAKAAVSAESSADNQNGNALSDVYINFIKSKSNANTYLIYDIDKDGYPEVFIGRQDPGYRAFVFDIYSYKKDAFVMLDTEFGPGGHIAPVFASYPDGNGVLEYSVHKGKELIQLHSWADGNHSEKTVYLEDYSGKYYSDSFDQTFDDSYRLKKFINHQFYKGENSSPLYEGSLLLAQSATNDYTAVYEALEGSVKDESKAKDDSKEQNLDEITLKTLKSFIGKQRREILYDTNPKDYWGTICYETVKTPKMYGYEGKVLFEFKDDKVIDVFWTSTAVRYEDIDKIIQDIRDTTGLDAQELQIDELYWTDTSEHVQYYIKYHEGPIVVGVKIDSAWQGEGTAADRDPAEYKELLTKYSAANAEKWDKSRLTSEKLNYQISDLGEIGYLIEDINNDGIPELMIGAQNPPYDDFQNAVLDMYTLDHGKPKMIFSGTERVFGYLSDKGILMVVKHDGAEATLYQYDFLDPKKLEFYTKKSVCYDGFYDHDHPWFSDYSHSVSYTEEEAKSIMATYPKHTIDYISFAG